MFRHEGTNSDRLLNWGTFKMNLDATRQLIYVDLLTVQSTFDFRVMIATDAVTVEMQVARALYCIKHGRGDLVDASIHSAEDETLESELVDFAIFCALRECCEAPLIAVFHLNLRCRNLARIERVRAIFCASMSSAARAARFIASYNLKMTSSEVRLPEIHSSHSDLGTGDTKIAEITVLRGDSGEVDFFDGGFVVSGTDWREVRDLLKIIQNAPNKSAPGSTGSGGLIRMFIFP